MGTNMLNLNAAQFFFSYRLKKKNFSRKIYKPKGKRNSTEFMENIYRVKKQSR